MFKKVVCSLLTVCMLFAMLPALRTTAAADNVAPDMSQAVGTNNSDTTSQYTSDWRYWSQGASRYYNKSKNDSGMRYCGCRVVSQVKLLAEAGVVSSDVNEFNPDIYFEWGNANGYFGPKGNLYGGVLENGNVGCGLKAYAESIGVIIDDEVKESVSEQSYAKINARIMDYLNKGYYVIIGSGDHHAYVGRDESLSSGVPVIWDSKGSCSYNADLRVEKTDGSANVRKAAKNIYCYKVTTLLPEYVRNQCTQYSTSVKLSVVVAGNMMSLPCEGRTYAESEVVTPLTIGSGYTATNLVVNSVGNCWYAVRNNDKTGYIYCGDVTVQQPSGESISFSNVVLPENVKVGKGFGLRGELSSSAGKIKSLMCSVYPNSDLNASPVLWYTQDINGYSMSIKNSDLNASMTFSSLSAGSYTLVYDVFTDDYYAANNSVAQFSNKYTIAAKSFTVSNSAKTQITQSMTAANPYIDTAVTVPVSTPVPTSAPIPTPAPTASLLPAYEYAPGLTPSPVYTPVPTPTPTPTPTSTPVPTPAPTPVPVQESTLKISSADYPSGHYDSLRNYGLRGIISSNYPITQVCAYVNNTNGQTVMNYSSSPSTYEYNVKTDGLNNSFKFGSLGSGCYTYVLYAEDSSGKSVNISSSFDIGTSNSGSSSSSDAPYPINNKECWMTVNVGRGSTLTFRSDVNTQKSSKICSIKDGTSIYVYGTTTQQYNGITWAWISYNDQNGWVDYKWLA